MVVEAIAVVVIEILMNLVVVVVALVEMWLVNLKVVGGRGDRGCFNGVR